MLNDKPKIVGVLTNLKYINELRKYLRYLDIIEFRVDLFKQDKLFIDKIIKAGLTVKNTYKKQIILTFRSEKEKGLTIVKDSISDLERLEIYSKLIPFCDYIDIELSSVKINREISKFVKRHRKKLIVSYHDFKITPDNKKLHLIIKNSMKLNPDFIKIAATANSDEDFIRFMNWTNENKRNNLITISMGKYGILSRYVSFIFGSKFLYGYIFKTPVVKGQVSVKELSNIFNDK